MISHNNLYIYTFITTNLSFVCVTLLVKICTCSCFSDTKCFTKLYEVGGREKERAIPACLRGVKEVWEEGRESEEEKKEEKWRGEWIKWR